MSKAIRLSWRQRWLAGVLLIVLLGGAALFWWRDQMPWPAQIVKETITTANQAQQTLQPRQQLGAGRSTQVIFGAQETLVAVATDVGLYLYETASFTQRHFWATATPVQSVAIAADGSAIAFSTRGDDQKLYRWQSANDELTVLDLDESLMHGLYYSPDGTYLVGVSFYHLLLWDAATLAPLVTHQQPSALTKQARFSPDGQLLAVLYKETLELWHLTDHTLLQTITLADGHYFSPETVAFAPDGHQLAAAALREPLLYRWQMTADQHFVDEAILQLSNNAATVADLQFAPVGDQLAVGLASGRLQLYDSAAATPLTSTIALTTIDKVAWSTDGTLVATGGTDGAIPLWSAATLAEQQQLALPPHAVGTAVTQLFFNEANDAVTAVLATGAIYRWQLSDGTMVQSLEAHSQGRINSVAFTPDGAQLVIGAENGVVQLWDAASGLPTETIYPPLGHVDAVMPDATGQSFAIAASKTLALGIWADPVYLWDGRGAERPFTVLDTDDTGFVTSCGVYWNSAVFSADGKYLATTAYAHKAMLWRVADGALVQQFEGHSSAILDIALSPDGTLLATASDDEEVRIWRTADGGLEQSFGGHAGGAVAVAFAPDGQSLATRSAVGDLRRWSLTNAEPELLRSDVRNPRSNLAFSSDGTWLATGGRGNVAYLWPMTDPAQLYELAGHNGLINAVAFSPDGTTLATASDDGTVALWDVPR